MDKGKQTGQKFDIYQTVTNAIVSRLENHEANDYQNTWFSASGEIFASNPVSGANYNGLNQLYLSSLINDEEYTQNRWMTLKQGNTKGAKVKKGEHSSIVFFYTPKYIDADGKNVSKQVMEILNSGGNIPEGVTRISVIKYHPVFNLDQFENVPEELKFSGETLTYSEPEKDELVEEILQHSGAKIEFKRFQKTISTIATGRTANYYVPSLDKIVLAERKQFKEKEAFYSVALHELGHWTGHESRMNRNLKGKKDSKEYALEELTAELFSVFMAARVGFTTQITNTAAYIKLWISFLNDDKKFIFSAAAQAEKAVRYVSKILENGIVLKPDQTKEVF